MKSLILTVIAGAALLTGCGAQGPSSRNMASGRASADQRVEAVDYAAGASSAPLTFPPKEAPRLKHFVPVTIGSYVEWKYRENLKPVGYRFGEVTLIVRGPEFPAPDYSGALLDPVVAQIRVKAPGTAEYVHEFDTGAGLTTRFTHGRLDRAGTPYVLANSFTGGAHCCSEIELFIAHPDRIEYVNLDVSEDGFPLPEVRDVDRDGTVDFIVSDQVFINRFTGWADGRVPPRILNVIDGKVRDVSPRPGFRRLFAKAARELRQECLHPGQISPNGACAAYVAAAGRAGDFKTAWAEMLKAYDRGSKEGLQCRLSLPDEACPSSGLTYANYPEALRAFLRERGYPTT